MNQRPDEFLQELVNAGRVLVKARVLPAAGPLSDEQIGEVRALYLRHFRELGIDHSTVASETGLPIEEVKAFCYGEPSGDIHAIARMLNGYVERDARRRQSQTRHEFIPTTIAQEIDALVSAACGDEPAMLAVIGPSGCGKSIVLKALAERYHGHFMQALDGYTPRTFLIDLARAVGAREAWTRNEPQLLRGVVAAIQGTRRPIFVDEAHRLAEPIYGRLRSIHDLAGVPIIMAGTAAIIERVNDRAEGRGQFASRCLQYNVTDLVMNAEGPDGGPQAAAGRPLFTIEEVKQFLDSMQVRFDDGGLRMAWAVACLPNHGCLRTIRRCVQLIRRTKAEGEPITRRDFAQALALLFGRQGHLVAETATRHQTLAASA